MTRLRFDLEWRTALLTAFLFPLLIALGFWQIERAGEKADIAAMNTQRAAAPPVALTLLDNQVRGGRYGHDVVGVFVDDASGLGVLLNRGWVPGDPSRRSLPDVTTPKEALSLTASVYVPPGEPYLLEEESFANLGPSVLVQQVNGHALREAIEARTGLALFPRELRLAPGAPAGFRRDWPVVNVSPDKHRGYAFQWFTMAAVLMLFFVFRSTNLGEVLASRRHRRSH